MTTVETHPLIAIRSTAPVQDAARLMADCSISAVGVTAPDGSFAGIVTERDLSWFVARGGDAKDTAIADIVNDFPVVVDGPLDDRVALERMRRARVRHLIVREGSDLRIVSLRDFLLRLADSEPRRLPTAREVMTAPAVACREDAFFEEVAETLAERDISGMPVVDRDGRVVGVVSERDLAHAVGGPLVRLAVRRHSRHALHAVAELPREARRAREIMTSPPVTVDASAPLEDVARAMRIHQVNRVPVLEHGRLAGVVTRGDVLGALARLDHRPIDLTAPPVLVGSAGLHPARI